MDHEPPDEPGGGVKPLHMMLRACGCARCLPAVDHAEKKSELRQAYHTEAHKLEIVALEQSYSTDVKQGLSVDAYEALLRKHGPNVLTARAELPAWLKFFLVTFTGFFNLLLWGGSVLCFIAYGLDTEDSSNLYLGIVLAVVVFVTGCFQYYQEAKSAAIMAGFKRFLPPKVTVIRGGQAAQRLASSLVPGDLIQLRAGEAVPADIRIVECSTDAQVDNSSLTGESEPQDRSAECTHDVPQETKNLGFFGTKVIRGALTGVVINTAGNTMMGRIASLADATGSTETPIKREITHFVHYISVIAIIEGIFVFVAGLILGTDIIKNLIYTIGMIVANVPEGLLATVTVTLALTAKKMAGRNVLVKNLEAVETLGSTTCICSDKTGTLTTNVMTVGHVYYGFERFEVDYQDPLKGEFSRASHSFQSLLRIAALCNNASYEHHTMTVTEANELVKLVKESKDVLAEARRILKGDASEQGITRMIEPHFGHNFTEFRAKHPQVYGIPFNSANKFQLSVHVVADDTVPALASDGEASRRLLVMKGAPEVVLRCCDSYLQGGKMMPLDAMRRQAIEDGVRDLADVGERVLAFAQCFLDPVAYPEGFQFKGQRIEDCNLPLGQNGGPGLCFVGLISLIDPPRQGVPSAVAKCHDAGIKVIMVTGDHPITAKAIARKVGIIQHDTEDDLIHKRGMRKEDIDDSKVRAIVVEGYSLAKVLEQPVDEQNRFWNRVLNKENVVFARTSPQQKLLIVEACQARGAIVAVTGDGVNDAPALKQSDIGIAMGIAGTDVAKDSADMLLLDDNFASIVNGIEEGRQIFDNLKKSIAYTLTSNVPELTPFFVYVILGMPLALTTVLILCIDLGTDMIPAISFAYENKEADLMKRPPRNAKRDRLVEGRLIAFSYLQVGIVQAIAGFFTFLVVMHGEGFPIHRLVGVARSGDFGVQDLTIYRGDSSFHWGPVDPFRQVEYHFTAAKCEEVLGMAQTAYFASIVLMQVGTLLACRTRILSMGSQGWKNNLMLVGLVTELALVVLLTYTPAIHSAFGTRSLPFEYWLPPLPFLVGMVSYDELRKYAMRKTGPSGWISRTTKW